MYRVNFDPYAQFLVQNLKDFGEEKLLNENQDAVNSRFYFKRPRLGWGKNIVLYLAITRERP